MNVTKLSPLTLYQLLLQGTLKIFHNFQTVCCVSHLLCGDQRRTVHSMGTEQGWRSALEGGPSRGCEDPGPYKVLQDPDQNTSFQLRDPNRKEVSPSPPPTVQGFLLPLLSSCQLPQKVEGPWGPCISRKGTLQAQDKIEPGSFC